MTNDIPTAHRAPWTGGRWLCSGCGSLVESHQHCTHREAEVDHDGSVVASGVHSVGPDAAGPWLVGNSASQYRALTDDALDGTEPASLPVRYDADTDRWVGPDGPLTLPATVAGVRLDLIPYREWADPRRPRLSAVLPPVA